MRILDPKGDSCGELITTDQIVAILKEGGGRPSAYGGMQKGDVGRLKQLK